MLVILIDPQIRKTLVLIQNVSRNMVCRVLQIVQLTKIINAAVVTDDTEKVCTISFRMLQLYQQMFGK